MSEAKRAYNSHQSYYTCLSCCASAKGTLITQSLQPSVITGECSIAPMQAQVIIPSQNRIEVNWDKTRFADYIECLLWLLPND